MRHRSCLLPLLGALAVTALALGGCDAFGELDNFDIAVKSSVTIPDADEAAQALAEFPEFQGLDGFDLTRSATFQNGGYDASKIDSVAVSALTLTALEPAGRDLSFLGSVVFHIESPGQPRVEIARRDGFPAGETSVTFATSAGNLKSYMVASQATITATLADSAHPEVEVLVQVEAVFHIDAGFM